MAAIRLSSVLLVAAVCLGAVSTSPLGVVAPGVPALDSHPQRSLLHAGHAHEEEPAAPSDFLAVLTGLGQTPSQHLISLTNSSAGSTAAGSSVVSGQGLLSAMSLARVNLVANGTSAAKQTLPLTAAQLVTRYGQDGQLNNTGLQQAAVAILSCQADSSCQLEYSAQGADSNTSSLAALSAQQADGDAASTAPRWLQWTAVAVLAVEAMVGTLVPIALKYTVSSFDHTLLGVLNCFAGGVFLTLALMHFMPDLASMQSELGFTRFPISYLMVAIGFYTMFVIEKVFAHKRREDPVLGCTEGQCACGDACAGNCGTGLCRCRPRGADDFHKVQDAVDTECGTASAAPCCAGKAAATTVTAEHCSSSTYKDASAARAAQGGRGELIVRRHLFPSFIWTALVVHSVFEGLAIGLATSKSAVVTVFVAMASHKWVESLTLACRFLKAGAGIKGVMLWLVPFALGAPLGIIVGITVSNDSAWTQLILTGLVTGFFIFVGAVQINNEEFNASDTVTGRRKALLVAAALAGFVLIALLQLIQE